MARRVDNFFCYLLIDKWCSANGKEGDNFRIKSIYLEMMSRAILIIIRIQTEKGNIRSQIYVNPRKLCD